jgi:proteasome lid subunit RPN8/RPN11
MTPLALPAAARRAILAHARRAHPRECCGFLIGAGRRVHFTVPMRNVARGRTRYRIDPAAHIRLLRVLRAFFPPMGILGVYHSHPEGDARPSPTDVAQAAYASWWYLIVGLRSRRPTLKGFRIDGGQVREIVLRIADV